MKKQPTSVLHDYIEDMINHPPVTTCQQGINFKPTCTYDYVISWDRCATPALIFGWIEHLSRKRWCTPMLIAAFVREACDYHGLDIDRG